MTDRSLPSRVWTLLAAGVFGRMPVVMLPLATYLLVADAHSATAGGVASGAMSLAIGFVGLGYGKLVDRGATRLVLLGTALACVPLVGVLVAVHDRSAVLAAVSAFAVGLAVAPIGPVVRAALADLGEDPMLRQRVFAFEAMSVEVQWIGGPLLVSAAVALTGAETALMIAALLGVAGNAGVGVLTASRGRSGGVDVAGAWFNRAVFWVVAAFGAMGFGMAAATIAITETTRAIDRPALSGVLIAVWGSGSLLGGAFAARASSTLAGPVVGAAVAGLTALVAVADGRMAVMVPLLVLAGVPIAPFVMAINTLAARAAPPHAQVRVFAALAAAGTVTGALGSSGGARVADAVGPATTFLVAGAGLVAAAVACFLASTSATRTVVPLVPVVE